MRGFILRALPVLLLACTAGCFLSKGELANPTAARTPTHTYWHKADEILSREPAGSDLKTLVQLVREQTNALRELPTEGVDADLVAAVSEVIENEEEVIRRAEMAGEDAEILRRSQQMAVVFADANRKATESKKKLKALRGLMNDRHGGGFSPMG
jgi:hypothetical protein